MQIGIYAGHLQPPTIGGGFTHVDELLKGLSSFKKPEYSLTVIYSGCIGSERVYEGIEYARLKQSKIRNWAALLISRISGLKIFRNLNIYSSLEKFCEKSKIEVLWSLQPFYEKLENTPYIYTLWDLEHRRYPYLPEMRGSEWMRREHIYKYMLPRASAIVIGNEYGAEQIHNYYSIDKDRIAAISFFSPTEMHDSLDDKPKNFKGSKFVFYPAQFWPHKNHITAIKAIAKLKEMGRDIDIVFTGSDKGNKKYIQEYAVSLGVADRVHFLGFVKHSEMLWLYKNAICMAFFSIGGPNNYPPIEAMALGCPVIASDIPGHYQQLGNSVLYARAMDSDDWASKIYRVYSENGISNALIEAGKNHTSSLTVQAYLETIFELINKILGYRELWQR
jgi:glycosyltransferase involved in cell wall biosynthesis